MLLREEGMLTKIRNQNGFTLVEMAIVLIIIGLLLGGVLKGQELIDNARVKKTVNELNSVSVAFNGYLDRYNHVPGDDGPLATLQNRGGSWATVNSGGNADGILNITPAQAFDGTGESVPFWQALRASGFINGDQTLTGIDAMPRNSFQGLIGVAYNTTPITGMDSGMSVCMSEVPGKIAAQIDTQLDNGVPYTGTIRASLGVPGSNTVPGVAIANYSEALVYTICRKL
jgi:prepilin-type N-terminal cleavage/methylation domain-containing protein